MSILGLRPTSSELRANVLLVLIMSNLKTEGKKQINDQMMIKWEYSGIEVRWKERRDYRGTD